MISRRDAPQWMKEGGRAVTRTAGRLSSGVRTLPSFLLVGAQRGGTTSLFRTLVERNTATVAGGGISNVAPGTVTLRISAVRANTPGNCSPVNTIPGCVG